MTTTDSPEDRVVSASAEVRAPAEAIFELIADPARQPGEEPRGHLWRWELEPAGEGATRVTHTYDWTDLTDETRFERARATTEDSLLESVRRLADLAERG